MKIEISIKEIIEFQCSKKEQIRLANHILTNCLPVKDYYSFVRSLLKDELSYQLETGGDAEVIKACDILIKNFKQ
jgi:hypothetical protein